MLKHTAIRIGHFLYTYTIEFGVGECGEIELTVYALDGGIELVLCEAMNEKDIVAYAQELLFDIEH